MTERKITRRYVLAQWNGGPVDGGYCIRDSRETDPHIVVRMAYDIEVEGVYDTSAAASVDLDRLNRAWWESEGRQEYEDEQERL